MVAMVMQKLWSLQGVLAEVVPHGGQGRIETLQALPMCSVAVHPE